MSPSTIETLVLHSVVRVLLFRKRPSETNSGPGLETPTDAVTVVRLQLAIISALVQCSARSSEGVFCFKYFSTCLTQRILCESPFASFPVSCLLAASFFRHSETKARLPQTTTAAKEHRPYACQRHKELLGRAIEAKKTTHSPHQADKVRCSGNVH